jgi:exonuclease VII large subunit
VPAAEAPAKVWTISELNTRVHDLLETSFPEVWVEGEISNFRPYPSGHSYFSLKDALEALFSRPVDLVTSASVNNPYFRASLAASSESVYAV